MHGSTPEQNYEANEKRSQPEEASSSPYAMPLPGPPWKVEQAFRPAVKDSKHVGFSPEVPGICCLGCGTQVQVPLRPHSVAAGIRVQHRESLIIFFCYS